MNTPPIAGVTTKYWNMNTVMIDRMSVRPSGRMTMNSTRLASVEQDRDPERLDGGSAAAGPAGRCAGRAVGTPRGRPS